MFRRKYQQTYTEEKVMQYDKDKSRQLKLVIVVGEVKSSRKYRNGNQAFCSLQIGEGV